MESKSGEIPSFLTSQEHTDELPFVMFYNKGPKYISNGPERKQWKKTAKKSAAWQ